MDAAAGRLYSVKMNLQPNPLNLSPHDPGLQAAGEKSARLPRDGSPVIKPGRGQVRVGTAGWTDPTLTAKGVFYPPEARSSEDRLRYYTEQFSVVEVDSTYYAIPTQRNAELWSERSPANFIFDIKAHALMTGQPTEVSRLPHPIRDNLPSELAGQDRIYGKDLPPELYDSAWTLFKDALQPLARDGKLGSILMQYPRWFHASSANRDILLDAQDRLGKLTFAVEFRSSSWFDGPAMEETIHFMEEHTIPLVMVDGPQGMKSSIPPMVAMTAPGLAVVRFHGRRADTWEKPGAGVAERFRYFYDAGELAEWRPRVLEAAADAQEVHVIMNNCYGNYGTTNALEFVEMLRG